MEKYHSDDIHSDINFMIDAAYELEGLLLLAKSRGEDTDDEVLELIKQKINALQYSIESMVSVPEEETEETAENVETEDFEEDATETLEEPDSEEEADTEEPDAENQEESMEDSEEDITVPMKEENITEIVEENSDEDDTPITLDQAYIINKSKDLSTAFSLNDTYRFRRELFGNSAADMTDAINLANAMASYEEAEDYFYEDLGWDKDSEEVQDFMAIIKNHFIA